MALKRADNLAQHPDYRGRQREYDRIETLAREILAREECFSLKKLAVNGSDLIALGMTPGPQLGKTLNDLLEAVISGRVENSKEALLKEATGMRGTT
jgi:tRNA nucleotidyltransferase (CCA-adding enzyme)